MLWVSQEKEGPWPGARCEIPDLLLFCGSSRFRALRFNSCQPLCFKIAASPNPSDGSPRLGDSPGKALLLFFCKAKRNQSLGSGRGGGAILLQSWWSFRDKVIILIIPRSFFLPLNWTLCLSQLWLPFWTVSFGGLDACLGWVNSWMKIFSLAVFKMLPPFKSWTLWQQSSFCPDYHCHFGRSFPAEQTMEF